MVFLLTDSGHVRAFFGWGEGEGGGGGVKSEACYKNFFFILQQRKIIVRNAF